jgi:hypothetical protein
VSVDRRASKIDPFRERNSVLFQGNKKYKNPARGFCIGQALNCLGWWLKIVEIPLDLRAIFDLPGRVAGDRL